MTARYSASLFALLLAVAVVAPSCGKKEPGSQGNARQDKKRMRFPVEIAEVTARPVTYVVTAVGSVEAFEIVQVTARVAGAVDQVRFSEGRTVKKGDPLVDIDPDRYRLSAQAARAAHEKALAAKADAEAGLARRASVIEKTPGLIPGEELETWRTKVLAASADLAQAKAALDQAELNLRDALVRAPVAGVIQTRTVQTGLYVQPGTVMATLVRRDPLLLRFRVPEQDAARMSGAKTAAFRVNDEEGEYSAVITHIGASADERTRMVEVTAEIRDPRRAALRPGSFAEIRIPIGGTKQMPVIPQTAIRPSERGFLAYTVEGGIAQERVLSLGLRTDNGSVEVLSGVSAGEQLVIRGAEALRDGAAVRPAGKGDMPQDAERGAPPKQGRRTRTEG